MKSENCNIWTKRTAQLIVVFAILLVLFGSGCNTISPKLQDEYIRAGLSCSMRRVLSIIWSPFLQNRRSHILFQYV